MRIRSKSIFFILLFSLLIFFLPTYVQAAPYNDHLVTNNVSNPTKLKEKTEKKEDKYPEEIDKPFEKIVYDMIKDTLNVDLGSEMEKIIAGDTTQQVMSTMQGVYDQLMPVGLALIVLYFLLELIDKTTRDNFSLEHFFRLMLKLLVAKFLMENGWTILNSFIRIGNSIFGLMSVESVGITATLKEYVEEIQDASNLTNLAMIFQWAIPWVFAFVSRLISKVICWGRTIEIGVRSVCAPIAMADIFQDGFHGGGFRYLRKFFAVCLQAFVIMLVIQISGVIQGIVIGDGGVTMINSLVVGLTTCALVIKSQQIANDLVGA